MTKCDLSRQLAQVCAKSKSKRRTTMQNPFPANTSSIAKSGNNSTHCIVLLDESGSMARFRHDTIGGVNTLIEKQAKDKDGTKISIVKFEDNKVTNIFSKVKASKKFKISEKDYCPSGMTNLLDAIGITINKVNEDLSGIAEDKRPSIIFQIMTDGHENSSKEYTNEMVKNLVKDCEKQDWIFMFVGANIDAFTVGGNLGFNANAISNYKTTKTSSTFDVVSSSLTRMKSMRSMGMSNSDIYSSGMVYTTDEVKVMNDD